MPQFYLVSHVATTTDYSNITDLEVVMVAGQVRLFASTLYDGTLTSWALSGTGFNSAGTFQSFQELYDRVDTFADDVTAISSARIGTAQYLLTASGTENGITVWAVSNTGDITPKSSLGTDDDLWVAAPTAMEVATIGAKTYVVLASAGSSSLTVMSLDALGNLQVTDHVIDSQNSRFAGASALAVLEHQGQIYVIVGGADDGISVFLLRADGTRSVCRWHVDGRCGHGCDHGAHRGGCSFWWRR